MIEIYFGNRIIYLTDEEQSYFAHFTDRKQLKTLVEKFREGEFEKLCISHYDLNNLFLNFRSLFKYEEAAGGLVVNPLKQILVIKNHGVWQLPKGHVEEGETHTETAIREVMEECNIQEPTIVNQLPSTFHTFQKNQQWILKRTYWFKMMYKGTETPTPQRKEGIAEALWINKKDFYKVYENTYSNLRPIWEHI